MKLQNCWIMSIAGELGNVKLQNCWIMSIAGNWECEIVILRIIQWSVLLAVRISRLMRMNPPKLQDSERFFTIELLDFENRWQWEIGGQGEVSYRSCWFRKTWQLPKSDDGESCVIRIAFVPNSQLMKSFETSYWQSVSIKKATIRARDW